VSNAGNHSNATARTIKDGELTIAVRLDDDVTCRIELFGKADLASGRALKAALAAATERDRPTIVDLSGLEFIDSSGIAVLFQALQRSQERGHDLRFLRGPRVMERVFEIAGVTDPPPFAD
jgi:anti-anti-sigma factor